MLLDIPTTTRPTHHTLPFYKDTIHLNTNRPNNPVPIIDISGLIIFRFFSKERTGIPAQMHQSEVSW